MHPTHSELSSSSQRLRVSWLRSACRTLVSPSQRLNDVRGIKQQFLRERFRANDRSCASARANSKKSPQVKQACDGNFFHLVPGFIKITPLEARLVGFDSSLWWVFALLVVVLVVALMMTSKASTSSVSFLLGISKRRFPDLMSRLSSSLGSFTQSLFLHLVSFLDFIHLEVFVLPGFSIDFYSLELSNRCSSISNIFESFFVKIARECLNSKSPTI
ncbi:uncharacterized protein LOC112345609 [Selaginella moellendorffii]|uniref:uncharacterized protein LOC112345609 n=1 Tax=Selaginella moellendorffii TaxID=88036 RepID=UPI000D1C423E|nr:uncharacterized protein LOC112345609 [Selaginella moellendorffii]|eukprot:XP_024528511.1 uncharacterized protein LOC112345609 [Selaginella moellendorffii]